MVTAYFKKPFAAVITAIVTGLFCCVLLLYSRHACRMAEQTTTGISLHQAQITGHLNYIQNKGDQITFSVVEQQNQLYSGRLIPLAVSADNAFFSIAFVNDYVTKQANSDTLVLAKHAQRFYYVVENK